MPLTAPDVLSTSVVGRCLERDTCSEMPQHGLGLVCIESAPEKGLARLVAHEIDHLYGTLYTKRMRPGTALIPVSEYGGTGERWQYSDRQN